MDLVCPTEVVSLYFMYHFKDLFSECGLYLRNLGCLIRESLHRPYSFTCDLVLLCIISSHPMKCLKHQGWILDQHTQFRTFFPTDYYFLLLILILSLAKYCWLWIFLHSYLLISLLLLLLLLHFPLLFILDDKCIRGAVQWGGSSILSHLLWWGIQKSPLFLAM
jgi:hypothetical protein